MPKPLPPAGRQAGPSSTDNDRSVRRAADPLSETGVLRLLNEAPDPLPVSPSPPASRPTPARRDEELSRPSAEVESAASCPRCGHRLGGDLAICPRCRTRLATSSREWQAVYRQAANFLARR